MTNKILLIDGNNLAHRARHRFDNFHFQGKSSSVVYGGPFIVSSLLRRFPCVECYIPFDGGRAKERMALLPEYKNRDKKDIDDHFNQQLEDFRTIMSSLNVKVVHKRHEEADDYIYAIARANPKVHKTIVSSDKDFIPMLNPFTKIFNPSKDALITTESCKSLYGFTHKEFLDYLILKGDKSDHIPGVRGLGDVRIRAILDEYESIEGLFEADDRGKIGPSSPWYNYMVAIEEAYDLNMELIGLRYFYNKHRRGQAIPVAPRTWDVPKVEALARKYGIKAFRQEKFLKPFKQLT